MKNTGWSCSVQDTHLHAKLQRVLEKLEVLLAHEYRKGSDKIPKFTKQDIVDLVRQAWLSLDHGTLSELGYRQLGPTMPLDGSGDDQVYHDLKPWWDRIEGCAFRDQCCKEVESMWEAGYVRSWTDAQMLIEEHAPHAVIEEGLEHCPWDIGDEQALSAAEDEQAPAEDEQALSAACTEIVASDKTVPSTMGFSVTSIFVRFSVMSLRCRGRDLTVYSHS